MEDRDYRSEVGKKIEEALEMGDFDLVEDLIEVPPMETFMQWAEKGEEKRKKRICRKRILVSCIAVVVVSASVLIGLKCFALPEVTADPDSGIDIELNDMESVTTYKSWDALPDEIKEQFIEVKNLPEGYEVEGIDIGEVECVDKIKFHIANNKVKISIRQTRNIDGSLPTSTVPKENKNIIIEGIEVFVEENSELKIKTYKFINGNVMIDIVVPIELNEEDVKHIINTVL